MLTVTAYKGGLGNFLSCELIFYLVWLNSFLSRSFTAYFRKEKISELYPRRDSLKLHSKQRDERICERDTKSEMRWKKKILARYLLRSFAYVFRQIICHSLFTQFSFHIKRFSTLSDSRCLKHERILNAAWAS